SAMRSLADLMIDKNVPQPRNMAANLQQDVSRMQGLTGPEFDREFVNLMVMDHQKTVELFRDQQTTVQNPDVRKYVEEWAPRLEMHLDKARELQSELFSAPAKHSD